jgi:hypothetical protein
MTPLPRKLTHDAAHAQARRLAERLARTDAERYVTSASLARRPGRLFIDYLRNGRRTTAVGIYSSRVREGFPIAAPVNWKQVERGIRPDAFTISPSRRQIRPNEFVAQAARPAPRNATGRSAAADGASAPRPVAEPSPRGQLQPTRDAISHQRRSEESGQVTQPVCRLFRCHSRPPSGR